MCSSDLLAVNVSPLLGLLGTVTGMITAFNSIALNGTGDAGVLAKGISEALYTTDKKSQEKTLGISTLLPISKQVRFDLSLLLLNTS